MARTPVSAAALEVSMPMMRAEAWGLVKKRPKSMPGMAMSST